MKPNLLVRILPPLLAFVVAFGGTAGLTLWAAEGKAPRKGERKAASESKSKSAGTDADAKRLAQEYARRIRQMLR